jgi:hypothetical protein
MGAGVGDSMGDGAAAGGFPGANGPAQQRLVDAVKAEFAAGAPVPRASIFKPAPPRPAPTANPIELRMVEEIECIRRHLDLLGSTLANDVLLVRRYATQLQSIDLINQQLGHLAAVVGTEDKAQAVERISLEDLRARLKRRPLGSL